MYSTAGAMTDDADEAEFHELGGLTLDLFTEIAILEHLVRHREPKELTGLDAAQFGIINYFCRLGHEEARVSLLAWSFQEDEPRMRDLVESLVELGLVAKTDEPDPCVTITEAGRERHYASLKAMGPIFIPVVREIPREDLEVTVRTLMELRRTFDNLPDR